MCFVIELAVQLTIVHTVDETNGFAPIRFVIRFHAKRSLMNADFFLQFCGGTKSNIRNKTKNSELPYTFSTKENAMQFIHD